MFRSEECMQTTRDLTAAECGGSMVCMKFQKRAVSDRQVDWAIVSESEHVRCIYYALAGGLESESLGGDDVCGSVGR